MHPVLARGGLLALYLGLWLLVGGLLTLLLVGSSGLTWVQAVAVAFPAASAYAFVCLSAWYVARSLPIISTGTTRILVTGVVAAVLSSAVWLALSRGWISMLVRMGLPQPSRTGEPETLIFGF